MVVQEKPKKGADHSILVSGSIKKQGNFHMRLVPSKSLHSLTSIVNAHIHIEGLARLMYHSLSNTLLSVRMVGRVCVHFKHRPGARSLWMSRSSSQVSQQSYPLHDLLQQFDQLLLPRDFQKSMKISYPLKNLLCLVFRL